MDTSSSRCSVQERGRKDELLMCSDSFCVSRTRLRRSLCFCARCRSSPSRHVSVPVNQVAGALSLIKVPCMIANAWMRRNLHLPGESTPPLRGKDSSVTQTTDESTMTDVQCDLNG
ncbi:unnamed protein product [Pleuronectes platessa]|uniref:Uncharacterized protein n=1 Tax=Pleuronectes platessa TaxID=8262 RepID=A0A9N7W0J1_PLEPL|nr:unnamed protein product [Pleuronectes platessa]